MLRPMCRSLAFCWHRIHSPQSPDLSCLWKVKVLLPSTTWLNLVLWSRRGWKGGEGRRGHGMPSWLSIRLQVFASASPFSPTHQVQQRQEQERAWHPGCPCLLGPLLSPRVLAGCPMRNFWGPGSWPVGWLCIALSSWHGAGCSRLRQARSQGSMPRREFSPGQGQPREAGWQKGGGPTWVERKPPELPHLAS